MDRFIVLSYFNTPFILCFKIQYGQIYRTVINLKTIALIALKSNMDRFIAAPQAEQQPAKETFKIQYGQIYRKNTVEYQSMFAML